jgi:hypothetical protein
VFTTYQGLYTVWLQGWKSIYGLQSLFSFYPPSGAELCNLLHALNWLSPLIPIQVVCFDLRPADRLFSLRVVIFSRWSLTQALSPAFTFFPVHSSPFSYLTPRMQPRKRRWTNHKAVMTTSWTVSYLIYTKLGRIDNIWCWQQSIVVLYIRIITVVTYHQVCFSAATGHPLRTSLVPQLHHCFPYVREKLTRRKHLLSTHPCYATSNVMRSTRNGGWRTCGFKEFHRHRYHTAL